MERLKGKVAVVFGAGQSPGEEMGNGRATTIRFVQEGASVLASDLKEETARESLDKAGVANPDAFAMQADVSNTDQVKAVIDAAMAKWGRIDILHYNVGVSIMGGPQTLDDVTDEIFDKVNAINLRGAIMACKFVAPIMRKQGGGSITLISSMSAIETYTPLVVYRTSKAGMIAHMQQMAIHEAPNGIRVNCILPGLMETSMSITTRVQHAGRDRDELIAERNSKVPLRRKGGTGWDIANAAVFLNSDEANFITGVALPVDGGTLVKIGWHTL